MAVLSSKAKGFKDRQKMRRHLGSLFSFFIS